MTKQTKAKKKTPKPITDSKTKHAKVITCGSVCTGMGTDCMALDSILSGVTLQKKFACDTRIEAKKFCLTNFKVEQWHDDVAGRAFRKGAGYVDIFTAGFPCQPFSTMGKGEGTNDSLGRGLVIEHIIRYLHDRQPKIFLLENVRGLLDQHPETLMKILTDIRKIKNSEGKNVYRVQWKIMDSMEYGAVPQHRPRLYICGLPASVSKAKTPFPWPKPLSAPSLKSVLDKHPQKQKTQKRTAYPSAPQAAVKVKAAMNEMRSMKVNPSKVPVAIDCDGITGRWVVDHVPCLTATRAASGGFWITCKGSKLSVREMMRLQGMRPHTVDIITPGLSDSKIGHMIGNAFTQSVVERILYNMIEAAGLCSAREMHNRFHDD